jgi:hypothetical protein
MIHSFQRMFDALMNKLEREEGGVSMNVECVGVLHTHLGFIFPKVFPMFISHYPVS